MDLYTPIVKGWLTEMSQELTSHGIQVHGGMGYIEETGSAQFYRDARITTIYEGTTAIQANDLVGRKILADSGEALTGLLQEIQVTAEELIQTDDLSALGHALAEAVTAGTQAQQWLLDHAREDRNVGGAAGVNLLMLLGYVCGGWVMGVAALKASGQLAAGAGDSSFLEAKQVTARFYGEHYLPRAVACLASVQAGPESIMALTAGQF